MHLMISGGGAFTETAAITSADGTLFFLPIGRSVSIYSCTTGYRVQQLQGHTAKVTGIALHPSDKRQVRLP